MQTRIIYWCAAVYSCFLKSFKAGIICAGYDDTDGPSVYSIPLGGTLVRQPFAIGGATFFV